MVPGFCGPPKRRPMISRQLVHTSDHPRHPAAFPEAILKVIDRLLGDAVRVLDPFAGTGRIHELDHRDTVGVEIEAEWADLHPRTIVGDALALPFDDASYDAIATSPTYGNRMADHHEARDDSHRNTYRHVLGRPLSEGNSGRLQWGPEYCDFHTRAWTEAVRVLRPGGRFVLNISDHIRRGRKEHVAGWHVSVIAGLGLHLVEVVTVDTPRLRFGANRFLRAEGEQVALFTKMSGLIIAEAGEEAACYS